MSRRRFRLSFGFVACLFLGFGGACSEADGGRCLQDSDCASNFCQRPGVTTEGGRCTEPGTTTTSTGTGGTSSGGGSGGAGGAGGAGGQAGSVSQDAASSDAQAAIDAANDDAHAQSDGASD